MRIKKNKRKKITRKSRRQVIAGSLLTGLAISAVVCVCGFEGAKLLIDKAMEEEAVACFLETERRAKEFQYNYEARLAKTADPDDPYAVTYAPYSETAIAAETASYSFIYPFEEETSALIFDEDTQQLVGDTFGKMVIVFKRDQDNKSFVLTCDNDQPEMKKIIDKYNDEYSRLNKYYICKGEAWCEILFNKIYINEDDMTFIPAGYEVSVMDVENGDQYEKSYETFTIDTEAPAGCELAEGYGYSMSERQTDDEELHELMQDISWDEYGKPVGGGSQAQDKSVKIYSFCTELKLGDKNYLLVNGLKQNGWSAFFQRWFYVSCGIFTFVTLAVALVSALIRYTRMKAAWDIEDYRINTSNALAHDLKTPLTAMIGYAQNLKECESDDERGRYADSIIENAVYTNELINSYFELSRAEQLVTKKRQNCELVGLSKELFSKYAAAADDRKITVSFEGECSAECDPDSISRAVENLLSNAVKYTPACGSIKIAGNGKALTVTNTVNEKIADVSKLTEPFYKPDNSRSGRSGSGLGLAIVKQIIDAHSFTLTLECGEDDFTAKVTV